MPRGVPGSGPKKKTTKKSTKKSAKKTYKKSADATAVSTPIPVSNELVNIELADGTRIENVSVESAMKFIQLRDNQKKGKTGL